MLGFRQKRHHDWRLRTRRQYDKAYGDKKRM